MRLDLNDRVSQGLGGEKKSPDVELVFQPTPPKVISSIVSKHKYSNVTFSCVTRVVCFKCTTL